MLWSIRCHSRMVVDWTLNLYIDVVKEELRNYRIHVYTTSNDRYE